MNTSHLALISTCALLVSAPALAQQTAVQPWKPANISSPRFESHPAFDPKTGDLYFVRSTPQFQGWHILVSHCTDKGWSSPEKWTLAGDGVEADPFFTDDGKSMYFISTRSVDGVKRTNLDIFRIDRINDKWGEPQQLPEPVNSAGAEWFPRPSKDGWLYFGSDRPGGKGATDIYRAQLMSDGKWTIENLGDAINTAGDEYEPLPSPDGTSMIIMADGDLFESHMTDKGWSARTKLAPEINQPNMKVGALFSPSGKSLLFARDTGGAESGEFFVWHISEENWPPECPPKK